MKLKEKYDVDGKPLQEDLTTQDLYQGSLVDVLTKFSMMIGFQIDPELEGIDGTKVSNSIAAEPNEEELIIASVRT